MYQVLYRKWRPQQFGDVYGQPYITSALQNAVSQDRISHAYLFTGSRGTGKTSCAKILAKAVNCLHPQQGNPCNECEVCKGVDQGTLLDIVEIDAASNNGVDNIRELREETSYTPSTAKYRVYIIDEVHMLSIGAFNALLKTLEEPPSYVIFILATTEVHKLPATILSRCQRFDFRRIPAEDIAARLSYVAQQEGRQLQPDAALLIARLADGALRDALSMLDLCMAEEGEIGEETVSRAVGIADRGYLYRLAEVVAAKDAAAALSLLSQLHQSSCDMQRLCGELLQFFRNCMICKTLRQPADVLVVSAAELQQLQQLSALFSLSRLLEILDVLQQTLQAIGRGGDRRIEMEMTAVKLCNPSLTGTGETNGLAERLEALEERLTALAAAPLAVTQTAAPPPSPIPAPRRETPVAKREEKREEKSISPPLEEPLPTPPPAPADLSPEQPEVQPFTQWGEVLDLLKESAGMLYSMLARSTALLHRGNMVVIEPEDETFSEIVRKDNNAATIRSAIKKVTGQSYRLAVSKPKKKSPVERTEDPLEDFLNRHSGKVTLS